MWDHHWHYAFNLFLVVKEHILLGISPMFGDFTHIWRCPHGNNVIWCISNSFCVVVTEDAPFIFEAVVNVQRCLDKCLSIKIDWQSMRFDVVQRKMILVAGQQIQKIKNVNQRHTFPPSLDEVVHPSVIFVCNVIIDSYFLYSIYSWHFCEILWCIIVIYNWGVRGTFYSLPCLDIYLDVATVMVCKL